MDSVSTPTGNSQVLQGFMQDLTPNTTAEQTLTSGPQTTLPTDLQPNISSNFTAPQVGTSWNAPPTLTANQAAIKGYSLDSLLPQDLQIANSPLISQYDNLAETQANPDQVTSNFFNQVEEPQLASEAVNQWMGGNLGTNGESTVGGNYMAEQQAQAAADSGLYGQQYVTNELNNLGGAVGNLLNERSNFFGNNVGLETSQNQNAIDNQLALNQQNLSGQEANASNQLATDQLNQGGQEANSQLTQSGLGMLNNFGLSSAAQLTQQQENEASELGQYNQNQQQLQEYAQAVNATNQANVVKGLFGLGGGAASVAAPGLSSLASSVGSGLGSFMSGLGSGSSGSSGGYNTDSFMDGLSF